MECSGRPQRKYLTVRKRVSPIIGAHQTVALLEFRVDIKNEVLSLLDEVLSLRGRARDFTDATPLLGAIPELDSMAVVAVITGMEERFGFFTEDDEIDGSVFATVGSLVGFVERKITG